jgi:hypothetical protein
MMLATRRADVDRLNTLARAQLRDVGQLGPDVLEAGGRAFGVGDQVICGRNDGYLGVINGTRGIVRGLSRDGTGLTVEVADGMRVVLPAGYLDEGHLNHGYATTIHKAQGATTERTFILADEHLYQEAGYVALSRGRDRNDLYTTTPTLADHDGHGRRPAESEYPLRGLGRSRAQHAAGMVPELPGRSLAELETERRHLFQAGPDGGTRDQYRRAREVDALIKDRTAALGWWAVDLLGAAPRQPDRQVEWVRAAGELSAYRERHGIAYEPGIVPEDALERFHHRELEWTIQEVAPALDRTHPFELDHGHDLGLGL